MNSAPPLKRVPRQGRRSETQRLAVVLSHPVQYYSPWFQQIHRSGDVELRLFYLWNPDETKSVDRGFGVPVQWDIPLLEGYPYEFVPNRSPNPGTHHARGLVNPDLESRILKWNPDAVLLFGYAWQTHLRTIVSPRLRDIPFLFRGDSHSLCSATGIRPFLARAMRKLVFRRFDAFLSVGRAHRQYLLEAGVPEEKIFFSPHCIDNSRFSGSRNDARLAAAKWKTELGIASDRFVILFAGKFEEKKRPLDLLEAFLSLDLNRYPVRPALLFVGSGQLEDHLRSRAAKHVGKDVFFAPFQNQTEMPKVYATGNVLALPSYGRGETWGLAVNEAMNLEVPVLVSTHVGCGLDLVVESETGWRFEAGNRDDLGDRLREILSDSDRVEAVGRAAAQRVTAYSYAAATTGLCEAMQSLSANSCG